MTELMDYSTDDSEDKEYKPSLIDAFRSDMLKEDGVVFQFTYIKNRVAQGVREGFTKSLVQQHYNENYG